MNKHRKNRHHNDGAADKARNGQMNMKDNTQNNKEMNGNPAEEDAVVVDDMNATPAEEEAVADATNAEEAEVVVDEVSEVEKLRKENEELNAKLAKEKKEYMFLMADFDNYRKHVMKEKSELIKNAGEQVFKGLLPVVDDMELAIKHGENSEDAKSTYEGMVLIYKKLRNYMEQNGVKQMETTGQPFDADKQEAISVVPVPDEEQKGKVLDTVTPGYTINDKVLRHAKVVVAQ